MPLSKPSTPNLTMWFTCLAETPRRSWLLRLNEHQEVEVNINDWVYAVTG